MIRFMFSSQTHMRKVIHFRKKCIGCNACVIADPDTWFMDETEAKSQLINGKKKGDAYVAEIREDQVDANVRAAEACPVRIIQVSDKSV